LSFYQLLKLKKAAPPVKEERPLRTLFAFNNEFSLTPVTTP
jgi:hypothetical protein